MCVICCNIKYKLICLPMIFSVASFVILLLNLVSLSLIIKSITYYFNWSKLTILIIRIKIQVAYLLAMFGSLLLFAPHHLDCKWNHMNHYMMLWYYLKRDQQSAHLYNLSIAFTAGTQRRNAVLAPMENYRSLAWLASCACII